MMMFRSMFSLLLMSGLLLPSLSETADAQERDPALETYFSANALYNRKLYTMAGEEYEKFLASYGNHEKAPRARLGLALCRYALDDKKAAEPLFDSLCKEPGLENQQEIHNLHGQCLLALGRPDDAEQAFAWSANNGGDSAQKLHALVGMVEARYRQRKWPEVVQGSDRIFREHPGAAHEERIRFQRAVAHFELGMFEEAVRVLASLHQPGEQTPLMQHVIFLLAECCRELGRLDEAEQHYQETARTREGAFTAEALYRLGFLRFQRGAYREASRDFMELIEDHGASPHVEAATLYLGRCLLESDRSPQAEKVFQTIPEEAKEYGAARLWLARACEAQGKHERAEAILSTTLKQAPDSAARPELLYELGNVHLDQGHFDGAADAFHLLCQEFPESPMNRDALWLEAYSLHKAGRFDESLKRCNGFLEKEGEADQSPEVAFLKAENLFLMDRRPEAEPLYRAFLSEYPDHFYVPSARFRIGQVQYQNRAWQAALDSLSPIGTDPPSSPFFRQLHFVQGDCHYNLERWEEAHKAFSLFLDVHPEEANADLAALKASLALARMGKTERAFKALADYGRRYPESPFLPHALVELGRLHYDAGDYEEARRVLNSLPENRKSPHALFYLGHTALAEGREPEAIEHFRNLANRHPDHELCADARLQEGILQVRLQNYPEGQEALEAFLKAHPDHASGDQACFYLGVALARQERWDPAHQAFQAVRERYPDSALQDRALYEQAWCEKGRGRKDRARACYEAFLEDFPRSGLREEVVFELAELSYEDNEFDAAIDCLQPLLDQEIEPDQRERVLYRLGWNYFSSYRMDDAARCFETLIKEYPRSDRLPIARYQAGEARLILKEHEEAYRHFQALSDLGEADGYREQTLLRLGECAALTQRWKDAERVYDRFAEDYPESPYLDRALFGIGWALENQERYPEAIQAYLAVSARGQSNEIAARSQFQLGECLFALKRYDEAVKSLIKVEALFGYPQWSAKALLETGRALELMNRKAEAMDRYRELIDKYPESDAAAVARKKIG